MSERERMRPDAARPFTDSPGPEGVERLEEVRRSGEELLAAADEAIRRTLSADSSAFLSASRQEGGE